MSIRTIFTTSLVLIISGCDATDPTEPFESNFTHTVTELPNGFEPRDLNDRGEIVGNVRPSGSANLPMLWRDGRMIDLASSLNIPFGGARAINDAGEVVVSAQLSVPCPHGIITYLWRPAGAASEMCGSAAGIDGQGRVLLMLGRSDLGGTPNYLELWDDGIRSSLPLPEGRDVINAWGPSAEGSASVLLSAPDRCRPALSTQYVIVHAAKVDELTCGARASAPNAAGDYLLFDSGTASLVTRADTTVITGLWPTALNDRRELAGTTGSAEKPRFAIWREGTVTQVVPADSTLILGAVQAINDRGDILASTRPPGGGTRWVFLESKE